MTDDSGTLQLQHISPERYTFWVRMLKAVFLSPRTSSTKRNLQHPLVYFYRSPAISRSDRVDVKVMGREFHDPLHSSPSSAPRRSFRCWTLTAVCCKRQCHAGCAQWRAGKFPPARNAVAGGYELRLAYRNQVYSSIFAWQTTSSHISRLV